MAMTGEQTKNSAKTEADTCRELVTPKLVEAGWSTAPFAIGEQRSFTNGRIFVAGGKVRRGKQQRADYRLGDDFAFIGRQRRLRLDNNWFDTDLLFFHRRLRSPLLIDLKVGEFIRQGNAALLPATLERVFQTEIRT